MADMTAEIGACRALRVLVVIACLAVLTACGPTLRSRTGPGGSASPATPVGTVEVVPMPIPVPWPTPEQSTTR